MNLTLKVLKKTCNLSRSSSEDFDTTFLKELNRHAPLKKKM